MKKSDKKTTNSAMISDHISYIEAIKSSQALRLGIDNTPDNFALDNMILLADACFEPLRNFYGQPIGISSFFRSEELNVAVGGSATSQHCAGTVSGVSEAAIDIDLDIFNNGMTNAQAFEWLRLNVEFDQLIWEFGTDNDPDWVHVSYRKSDNRKRCLRSIKAGRKTVYNEMKFKN